MLGRTNTGGGGGGLNFQVIGGTTAPSNPKENMIWVNTSTKIKSYIFSATQPTAASGRVWFSTGTSSTVKFNALKKNGIQVYPISAKQYVSGVWADVVAKSYQGGIWVDWWDGYLYKRGDQYNYITGGWTADGYMYNNLAYNAHFEEDKINLQIIMGSKVGGIGTVNAIKFSGYSELKAEVSGSNRDIYMYIVSGKGNNNDKIMASTKMTTIQETMSLDIGTIDTGYIAFWTNSSGTIHSVWLE